jgi:hypothetical protein
MRRSITVEAYISEAHIEFIFHLLTICIILFSNVGGGWGWVGGEGERFLVYLFILLTHAPCLCSALCSLFLNEVASF